MMLNSCKFCPLTHAEAEDEISYELIVEAIMQLALSLTTKHKSDKFKRHNMLEQLSTAEKDLDNLRKMNLDLERQCSDMKDIVQTQMNHLKFYKQQFSELETMDTDVPYRKTAVAERLTISPDIDVTSVSEQQQSLTWPQITELQSLAAPTTTTTLQKFTTKDSGSGGNGLTLSKSGKLYKGKRRGRKPKIKRQIGVSTSRVMVPKVEITRHDSPSINKNSMNKYGSKTAGRRYLQSIDPNGAPTTSNTVMDSTAKQQYHNSTNRLCSPNTPASVGINNFL